MITNHLNTQRANAPDDPRPTVTKGKGIRIDNSNDNRKIMEALKSQEKSSA
jgi:hypothetical protein